MSDEAKFREAITELNAERLKNGVDIDGKQYLMVKDRVEKFRTIFGSAYGIVTDVDYNNITGQIGRAYVVAHAMITDRERQTVLASGHAMVWIDEQSIGFAKNAPVEVAETAAIGRALAAFGLHGGEYASGNEIQKAKAQDNKSVASTTKQEFTRDVQDQFPGAQETRRPTGLPIPRDNSKEEVDQVFAAIDMINNADTMADYYHELGEALSWLPKEEVAELNASFGARSKQIKAQS